MKKLLAMLLSVVMLLSTFSIAALAADEPADETEETGFEVSGSKAASPTALEDDARETTVTLSLPSGEYKNKIDVVFVIDSSGSTDLGTVFIDEATGLFDDIVENNPGVDLKAGVVLYTGRGNDAISYVSKEAYQGLVPYNETTRDYFDKSFRIMDNDNMDKPTFRATFGRGSGPHSGLDMADEWLKADTDVDDSHKYVILLTDGKGYIWNDDNNVPTTIYSQYYQWARGIGAHNVANGGKVSLSQTMGYNKGSYGLDVLDPSGKSNIVFYNSYEELFALTDDELTGVNEWDQKCTYALDTTTPAGSVVRHPTTNGVDLFGDLNYAYWYEWFPEDAWVGVKYLEMNPYAVIDNGDGTYTFDTNTINPYYYQYHFDCLQKGLYKAGHLWADMNEVYNCAAVTYDSSTGSGLELVGPFKEWLRANSKFSAKKADAAQISAMFEGIDNSIRYMVSRGVVTDVIKDDFTLKDIENPFSMTLAGEDLAVTPGDDENTWFFGESFPDTEDPDIEIFPYEVEYDKDTKTITWTLNVPVENLRQVTLSYPLVLREDAESGLYDTNESAVLDYTTTDEDDGTFTFEIPQVTYIKYIDVDVEKAWDDNDNEDGLRPENVQIAIFADGEEQEDLRASLPAQAGADGEWKHTFHVPMNKLVEETEDGETTYTFPVIEYDVKELDENAEPVDDGGDFDANYTASYAGSVEDGFTITNTEMAELTVTKIWDDDGDRDGKRPESIEVVVKANGDPIAKEPLILPEADAQPAAKAAGETAEADEWTAVIRAPKYENGEAIEYTVDEPEVPDGYESAIEGLTITNTYTPETTEVTVTKVWDDNDDQDGKRPESVTFTVTDADGEAQTVELSADEDENTWTATLNLPKYYNHGEENSFTVSEEKVPEGYQAKPDENDPLTIVNSYTPDLVSVTVTKEWDDEDDKDGIRPESVSVQLLANGEPCGDSAELTEGEKWTYTWYDLPKNADGEAIEYTIEELAVEGYECEIGGDAESGFTITNTHTPEPKPEPEPEPETTSLTVEKVWKGDRAGLRPKSITVNLVQGKKVWESVKITAKDNWTYTWEDLPADETYTVTEDAVANYAATIGQVKDGKITITNKYDRVSPPPTPVLNKEDHFAYIIGDDDGLARPNDDISRAEVATIFFRLLTDASRDELWSQENDFSDVGINDWFNNAVSTMANAGILMGYPDGSFGPQLSITRAEFATIAIRFFQDRVVGASRFTDVAGHWGEAYINMAAEKGLIKGYPDSTFHPDAPISRAEAMTIINRLLERHPHKNYLLANMITWPDNANPNAWYYADVQEATNSHEYTMGSEHEIWEKLLPVRDWAAFERAWSTAHSASNPGDVVPGDLRIDLSGIDDN